jgi:hypothetical protein
MPKILFQIAYSIFIFLVSLASLLWYNSGNIELFHWIVALACGCLSFLIIVSIDWYSAYPISKK